MQCKKKSRPNRLTRHKELLNHKNKWIKWWSVWYFFVAFPRYRFQVFHHEQKVWQNNRMKKIRKKTTKLDHWTDHSEIPRCIIDLSRIYGLGQKRLVYQVTQHKWTPYANNHIYIQNVRSFSLRKLLAGTCFKRLYISHLLPANTQCVHRRFVCEQFAKSRQNTE